MLSIVVNISFTKIDVECRESTSVLQNPMLLLTLSIRDFIFLITFFLSRLLIHLKKYLTIVAIALAVIITNFTSRHDWAVIHYKVIVVTVLLSSLKHFWLCSNFHSQLHISRYSFWNGTNIFSCELMLFVDSVTFVPFSKYFGWTHFYCV